MTHVLYNYIILLKSYNSFVWQKDQVGENWDDDQWITYIFE